ncbi:MAG: glycerate kinase [Candidatus Bathyarchaeota archaeon]|nr:MAG: glycerate kinase [Candidatus Bathyarchaeota archaeon]
MIQNRSELLSHGSINGRRSVLEIIEHALKSSDPYRATKKAVKFNDRELIIDGYRIDIQKKRNLYVIGAGKATYPIAKALEEILEDRITRGLIVVKRGQKEELKKIKKIEAGHPIPDVQGFQAAQEIMTIADEAKKDDLVFAIITGGSSALLPYPAEGISLEDLGNVNELLLFSGATIQEINAVRKHISQIKGGRLALRIQPAEIVNLTVSDVIGDWNMIDFITDNTVPDRSTFKDAITTLRKYNLLKHVPRSVRNHLRKADPNLETPKTFERITSRTWILMTNKETCEAAVHKAQTLGFEAQILSTMIEGESREAGIVHGGIAREIEAHHRPIKCPGVLISGGETTVRISGNQGRGGPNQEFILGFATKISGSARIVGAAVDTDGTDGLTDAAGGIADGLTMRRVKDLDLDVYESLQNHDSNSLLQMLGDTIMTGPTGTNVMNLRVLLVSR